MLLTDAHRAARTGSDGALVPRAEQDRSLWDQASIDEGVELIITALATSTLAPYQLQAAVAAVHAEAANAEATDWPQIVALYDLLSRVAPSPMANCPCPPSSVLGNLLYLVTFCLGSLVLFTVLYQVRLVPRPIAGWGLLAAVVLLVGTILAKRQPCAHRQVVRSPTRDAAVVAFCSNHRHRSPEASNPGPSPASPSGPSPHGASERSSRKNPMRWVS
jgi:hypothetical protein